MPLWRPMKRSEERVWPETYLLLTGLALPCFLALSQTEYRVLYIIVIYITLRDYDR